MNGYFILALIATLVSVAVGFSPINSVGSRVSPRGSTIVMDGKTRDLADRIKSVKNTRRITEAMRLGEFLIVAPVVANNV